MQALVEDLLTLARLQDRRRPRRRDDVDLDDVVAGEAERLRAMGRVTVLMELRPGRVTGDRAQLQQVVRNLVDNAARHARSTVRLGVHATPDAVLLSVDNDGRPVDPAERERVFDRFARLEEGRERDSGGSGLGLAIVSAVVQDHGGEARAGEAPDGWCRFEVTLPVVPVGHPSR